MQLNKLFTLAILLTLPLIAGAQSQKNSLDDRQEDQKKQAKAASKEKDEFKEVEVDFLINYYDQDGDHSPVTGGQGTEKLENIAPMFVIHVPMDSLSNLNINAGVDYYSSASTGNIDYFEDPQYKTSASHQDVRSHINLTYSRISPDEKRGWSILGGFSKEFDVTSFNLGGSLTFNSADQNRSFTVTGQVYNDFWKLIYPVEKRTGEKWLKDDSRMTYNLGLSYAQVINKRLHAVFSTDIVYQKGLLSTPFHRVFFDDAKGVTDLDALRELSHVEQLKDNRLKIPISMRWNYYVNDFMRLRTYYRFYTDSWGITAHTASIEIPFQLGYSFIVSPFYRFHTQTEADHFAPYGEFDATNPPKYFTSDYDLSDLTSQKVGIGLEYSPLMGLGNFRSPLNRKKTAQFKSIGLRTAYYDRSDGLTAWLVSLQLSFIF